MMERSVVNLIRCGTVYRESLVSELTTTGGSARKIVKNLNDHVLYVWGEVVRRWFWLVLRLVMSHCP